MNSTIAIPLYEGKLVRLTAFEPEHDAEIESQWKHDPEYLALTELGIVRPISAFRLRKMYEEDEKNKEQMVFAIRALPKERLIGRIELKGIEPVNRSARLRIGIGKPEDRGQGYGTEALDLVLRYSFQELGLFRLSAIIYEDNPAALRFFEKAGFRHEVRRRQAILHAGRRWDALAMGLLHDEWAGARPEEAR